MQPKIIYKKIRIYLFNIGAIVICSSTLSVAQGNIDINGEGTTINAVNNAFISTNNITIQTGNTFIFNGSIIQISGAINNSGIFDGSNGTLVMNGNSLQSIPINAFYNKALLNLVVNNPSSSGVSLGGQLDIYGSLTFSGTGMKFSTNDNLTFKSNSSGTAYLGDVTGNTITGQATVERYISAHKGWRFLSIPTNTGQTIQQTWQEGCGSNANCTPGFGTQITGAGGIAAGFDMASPSPSMKTYNPATNSWVGVPNTNATIIKATDGYMVFVRGDRSVTTVSAAATPTVLRTKGNLYVGNQPGITALPNQFAAIGNPYASAIDMRNIAQTGMKDFFYLWDPNIAGEYGYGGYQTFSNDGSGNYVVTPGGGSFGSSGSINNYIQSGQAFFMQASASGGSVTLKEGAKTTGSSLVSIPSSIPIPALRVNLFGVNADSSMYIADGILINYKDDYSNAVDDLDAAKAANTSENLSSKTANTLLAIERRHTISSNDTIHLNLTGVKVQNYNFEITAEGLYKPGLAGFLIDNYLHTATPVNIDGTTTINFSVGNIAGSYAANRFSIVFSQYGTLPVTFTSLAAIPQGNSILVQWKVENENNIKQYEVEKSIDGNSFTTMVITPATSGNGGSATYQANDNNPVQSYNYYRIKSADINGKTSYSNIVSVQIANNLKSDITIYPNPIQNGIINLQLTQKPEGIYRVRVMNQLGQAVFSKQIIHKTGNNSEPIYLEKNIAHGIYKVEIANAVNRLKTINIVY